MSRLATKLQKCHPIVGEGHTQTQYNTHEDIQMHVYKGVGWQKTRLFTSSCRGDAPPMPPSSVSGVACGCMSVSLTMISMSI